MADSWKNLGSCDLSRTLLQYQNLTVEANRIQRFGYDKANPDNSSLQAIHHLFALPGLVGLAIILAIIYPAMTIHNQSFTYTTGSGRSFPIEVSPDPVSLGILRAGQLSVSTMVLRNSSRQPMVIERIETSCPCLRIEPQAFQIKGFGTSTPNVIFDNREEPEFRGSLSILVDGYGPENRPLFSTRIHVTVTR